MAKTISVGELRQNPTRMLREVKAGATYTVTDHGEPIAEIAARRQPRWIPDDEIDSVLRELGADEAWAREIAAERAAVGVTDPWERLG
ncbi:MAG: type II toxin-antitoxin system prevent-host-death family antitoxin [Bifidobacteriaceae bacterium]|jgi:antitoxin (DNA-binding transcriptional repressor) of toxin-antitoxin stability system|nr:type II toxin-antitoxin system prevent-host-death family antitoxin [Bifidobacteriaceae bacterium]